LLVLHSPPALNTRRSEMCEYVCVVCVCVCSKPLQQRATMAAGLCVRACVRGLCELRTHNQPRGAFLASCPLQLHCLECEVNMGVG